MPVIPRTHSPCGRGVRPRARIPAFARSTDPHEKEPFMERTSRRRFLGTTAVGLAGLAALDRAPAHAQKRELTFLSWNHFVPAADDELRRQAEVFSKQAGVTVRIDTIAHLQLPAKYAAEAASQSGHDMILAGDAYPFLFENLLAAV